MLDPDTLIHTCLFLQNQASYGLGGAISAVHQRSSRNKTTLISVRDSTFKENNASLRGGAIHTTVKTKIQGTTFMGNSASFGGAVSCSSLKMTNCHFESNNAKSSAGALSLDHGSHDISHTNFLHNTAKQGGAICGWTNVDLTCSLCSFYNNTTGDK